MPRQRIGRYEITDELGKGAMGLVYKAVDPNIGRTVALKTMRVDVHGLESEEMLGRFQNEARAAGVLNHANIVTIYDAGEQEGTFYIAMEFIEGETLHEVLRRERVLPVERAIEIISQVCAGLDFAHARGVIHRDIKPANIMIEPDGTVKIMDFGIAKSASTGLTSTGQVLGTPNYMSPEQVKGRTLDGRSDLFSLGVVLYETLTGERPFTGDNVTTIIYKIVNEHPPAPADLDVTLHPGISAVVMKALAKAPEARYQNGAEFARDLRNYKAVDANATGTWVAPQPVPGADAPDANGRAVAASITSAGAAAAARAQRAPSLDSTVIRSGPQGPAPRSGTRSPVSSVAWIAIACIVVAGAYLGLRWRASRQPVVPATQMTSAQNQPARRAEGATPVATSSQLQAESASAATAGELRVTSTPAGAKVQIDGRSEQKWVTPFTAPTLQPGTHSVVLNLDGYAPERREVEIVPGQRASISAGLKAVNGFLAVNSIPAGAQILLDDANTGLITPSRILVDPGKHRLAMRKEGFRPQVTAADASAGQTIIVNATLKPLPGGSADTGAAVDQQGANPFRKLRRLFGGGVPGDRGVLEIRTQPRGAEIWVDGRQTQGHTPIKVPVPPGTYRVSLRMNGYKSIERTVTVEKGKVYGMDELLEKD